MHVRRHEGDSHSMHVRWCDGDSNSMCERQQWPHTAARGDSEGEGCSHMHERWQWQQQAARRDGKGERATAMHARGGSGSGMSHVARGDSEGEGCGCMCKVAMVVLCTVARGTAQVG